MLRALGLARRGTGKTYPNPLVGALVVRDREIVGRGFHGQSGFEHAEVVALKAAGELAKGATLYVTLEPCNHHGRTPPCVDAVLKSGVGRVVIASRDFNPNYVGGGNARLQAVGVQVDLGILDARAQDLNAAWAHWVQTKQPYLTLKLALSQDGKIAWEDGNSKWISGPISRAHVHRHRSQMQAILVGTETARRDNPELTNRSGRGIQPLRVVLDRQLDLPDNLQLFSDVSQSGLRPGKTIRVCSVNVPAERRAACESEQVSVLAIAEKNGRLDLTELCRVLGQRGVQNIYCEGGAQLGQALIEQNLVQELHLYHASVKIGAAGKTFKIPAWKRVEQSKLGADRFERCVPNER